MGEPAGYGKGRKRASRTGEGMGGAGLDVLPLSVLLTSTACSRGPSRSRGTDPCSCPERLRRLKCATGRLLRASEAAYEMTVRETCTACSTFPIIRAGCGRLRLPCLAGCESA